MVHMPSPPTATKKPSASATKCTHCNHPKPFHPDSKKCKGFGCNCPRFRKT